MTLEEKVDEMLSMLHMLNTKVTWMADDMSKVMTVAEELPAIRACVEQLARADLDQVQENESKRWKVEKL